MTKAGRWKVEVGVIAARWTSLLVVTSGGGRLHSSSCPSFQSPLLSAVHGMRPSCVSIRASISGLPALICCVIQGLSSVSANPSVQPTVQGKGGLRHHTQSTCVGWFRQGVNIPALEGLCPVIHTGCRMDSRSTYRTDIRATVPPAGGELA